MLRSMSALVSVQPALALWLLQPSAAVAGTIVFNDSSTLFVTSDVPGRVSSVCTQGLPEVCTVTLLPPPLPPGLLGFGVVFWQGTLDIGEMAAGDLNSISDTDRKSTRLNSSHL